MRSWRASLRFPGLVESLHLLSPATTLVVHGRMSHISHQVWPLNLRCFTAPLHQTKGTILETINLATKSDQPNFLLGLPVPLS